jgi:hypothetical protein
VSMRALLLAAAALAVVLAPAGCSDQTTNGSPYTILDGSADDGSTPDDPTDSGTDAPIPTGPANCTSSFGTGLTPVFGRLDGTVRVVVTPGLPKCRSDNDHVIVQVDVTPQDSTTTYPVLVNILSDIAVSDPAVRFGQTAHALLGPAWAPGWHTDVSLDYPTALGVHNATFAAKTKAELGTLINAGLPVGAKVSVYMFGFDTKDGGHKVHRNSQSSDGALVNLQTDPPTWLLFHFSQQTF